MEKQQVSALVVDDSALMRNLITRILESSDEINVVGRAMNGQFALQKIPKLNPDIIVLDLEMPEMNGIEFLKERRRLEIDVPVVILSSKASKGAKITMEALSLGASDFIMKPSGVASDDISVVAASLKQMALAYGKQYQRSKSPRPEGRQNTVSTLQKSPAIKKDTTKEASDVFIEIKPSASKLPPKREPKREAGKIEIIAIGISTGGPNALRQVFSQLNPELQVPILVVQHMPAGFTEEFAKSLNRICPLEVKEAADGDVVKPGRILIAPGDFHIVVEKKSLATIVRLSEDSPVNGHRPSADVLFESVAKAYSNRAVGVIMTGMGKDGAEKLGDIYAEGGITLGQDEASSVVYGMPRVAFEYGFVQQQFSLEDMAQAICDAAMKDS